MKKILLLIFTFIYSFSAGLSQDFLEPTEAFKPAFIKNKDLVFYSSETDEVKKSLEIRWFKERFPMI